MTAGGARVSILAAAAVAVLGAATAGGVWLYLRYDDSAPSMGPSPTAVEGSSSRSGVGSTASSATPPARSIEATDPEAVARGPRPEVIDIGVAGRKVVELETVEELSEEAANRLIELAEKVRRRDFDAVPAYLSPAFAGHSLGPLPVEMSERLPGDVERTTWGCSSPPIVARDVFVERLEEFLAPFENLDLVLLKTKGAEFDQDGLRGAVRLYFQIIGSIAGGGLRSHSGRGELDVRRVEGEWTVHRLRLDSMTTLERSAPMFSEVSVSSGVAHDGGRLGQRGFIANFYWSGAAVADVDGDGLHDIFVPSSQRNFLYRNRGDGGFAEIADAAGVEKPGGGTGCLFFDFDNDGDLDLFVAHVGWYEGDVPYGKSLQLFRNDGGGKYEDITVESGLERHVAAFSVAAADVDGDGYLDLYVSCYNRLDRVYPDSWFQARNGEPNLLFRNVGGKRFEETAAAAGVADTRWSYAAAFADYDEDGDQDLYVANDYGDNALLRNNGDGTFDDVTARSGVLDTGNGMAVAWGDADNDGDLDLYVSNMSSTAGNRILGRLVQSDTAPLGKTLLKLAAGNSIFLQEGGEFRRNPPSSGGIGASWAWGAAWLDIDLDARLDLYVANGFISGASAKDT